MSRYIDADEAIQDIETHLLVNISNIAREVKKSAIECIERTETADVQEVKRSHWQYYGYIGDSNYYKCCNCGEIQRKDTNYCPNCGARMEE